MNRSVQTNASQANGRPINMNEVATQRRKRVAVSHPDAEAGPYKDGATGND